MLKHYRNPSPGVFWERANTRPQELCKSSELTIYTYFFHPSKNKRAIALRIFTIHQMEIRHS